MSFTKHFGDTTHLVFTACPVLLCTAHCERYPNATIVFAAEAKNKLKGFVQLYPSFCSVDAIKIFILYDLYVDECDRKSGIGEALMNKAAEFVKESGSDQRQFKTQPFFCIKPLFERYSSNRRLFLRSSRLIPYHA